MKDYYKISEISSLYGIGPDSLRYYEKLGILVPRRDANGYRLYSLRDLYKLNIIRNLRELGLSMRQIKEYLDGQNVSGTLGLLHKEQKLIQARLKELKKREEIIQNRIEGLNSALSIRPGTFEVKSCRKRFCVQISECITRDEEMDFLIKKLHKKHKDKISDIGNQAIGAFLSMPDMKQGISNVYTSVFFAFDRKIPDHDFILPETDYLSYYYRGDYSQNAERVQEVLDYAKKHHLKLSGSPFEIYTIDNRDTICSEEFLTEIQMPVANWTG